MKKYRVVVNGVAYEVELEAMDSASASAAPAPAAAPAASPAPAPAAAPAGGQSVNAPMPGNILAVNVAPGQAVKAGQILFVLEAMKMENEILSPCDGTVGTVAVTKGQSVESQALLCTIA